MDDSARHLDRNLAERSGDIHLEPLALPDVGHGHVAVGVAHHVSASFCRLREEQPQRIERSLPGVTHTRPERDDRTPAQVHGQHVEGRLHRPPSSALQDPSGVPLDPLAMGQVQVTGITLVEHRSHQQRPSQEVLVFDGPDRRVVGIGEHEVPQHGQAGAPALERLAPQM